MSRIEINPQIKTALQLFAEAAPSAFITGRAGTGKSTLLRYVQRTCTRPLAVLAPTGVAALNVGGETIHSFFRFPPAVTVADAEKRGARLKNAALYNSFDTLVIDEISMVRADLLDCIDVFLRAARNSGRPFGGVQMIFIGDLYQLPPVVPAEDWRHFSAVYETPYFFSARVMTAGEFRFSFIELEHVYRQRDDRFIELLNAIRGNTLSDEQLELLNERVVSDGVEPGEDCVCLTTTNAAADAVNRRKLALLGGRVFTCHARITGDFDPKLAPADAELRLKKGAQVMFLNNNPDGLWVNGTIGVITRINRREIVVTTRDGHCVGVEPYKWTLYRYTVDPATRRLTQESIGSFAQVPLNLAWAVTIHKSQGKTFDRVLVDFGRGTFAHGQAYVALSRCRSLGGLLLARPLRREHVFTDYRVARFLTRLQYERAEAQCGVAEKLHIIRDAISRGQPVRITYLKPNDQKTCRTVIPRKVGDMEYQGTRYLGMEASCGLRRQCRVFRLDRILEISL